jgi:hypothetical protein
MVQCPFCHFKNEDGALFCEQCKSDLGAMAAEPVLAEAVPLAAEPVMAEPVALVAEAVPLAEEPVEALPVEAEPIALEPMPAEPMPAEPMPAEPMPAEPMPAEPMPVEPMQPEPVAFEPPAAVPFPPPSAPPAAEIAAPPPAPASAPTVPIAADAQVCLIVLRGQKRNVEYPVYEGQNFVGRADEKPVDIDLEDQEPPDRIWSSRQHALIVLENGQLTVEDLNSSNGTFVNRARIYPGQPKGLNPNDVVQIGNVQLKVVVKS